MKDNVLLRTENMSRKYVISDRREIEIEVLKDINLEIPDGQFIGVIGHTGSGKSTLIQHLNALIKPTSGTVSYNGEDVWAENYNRRALRSEVGLVFQYPEHQLFETDVLTDVCFGPKNQNLPPEECESWFLCSHHQRTLRPNAVLAVLQQNPESVLSDCRCCCSQPCRHPRWTISDRPLPVCLYSFPCKKTKPLNLPSPRILHGKIQKVNGF